MLLRPLRLIPVLALPALAACEGAVTIDISATPPEDVESAILRIQTLRLSREDGTTQDIDLGDDFEVDTLDLSQGRTRALISNEELSTGNYTGATLLLEAESDTLDSRLILDDNSEVSLVLRSGSSLTAQSNFSVNEDDDTNVTLHVDLRSSLLVDANSAGDRIIAPRMRMIENSAAGSIAGNVDDQVLTDGGCDSDNQPDLGRVMYVFSGANISPEEIDGSVPDPITTALINRDAVNADYVAAFLPAGDYTLALTCSADLDDPLRFDGILFVTTRNASVSAGQTTTVNFSLTE
ncbi:lipoprotein [Oceanococcus atlanticus]|uniref:Lipoprotein n=1 Tax=Oceanococcus atlanticus TaxID=1317117 RepID=A0A1Y1SHQ5_9GAMM|nr:DUF4382 domain-containing protein [Oceanococcus atlanticus]ORE89186.1 lipoprotein [Oceanococcus atlanticus]